MIDKDRISVLKEWLLILESKPMYNYNQYRHRLIYAASSVEQIANNMTCMNSDKIENTTNFPYTKPIR